MVLPPTQEALYDLETVETPAVSMRTSLVDSSISKVKGCLPRIVVENGKRREAFEGQKF